MREHLFKPLLAIALVLVCGNAWGADYTELFTIKSGDVISGTKYGSYEGKDDFVGWIITHGGNNYSVGTNKDKRSNCTLKYYTKYAVSPVTTGDIASAFVSTTKISDVSMISYTFNGGSNQTSTNVYLIYSADGSTFSQMSLTSGSQGTAIFSGTAYEFDMCSGYFGLLFQATNTSGDWRIDDVCISFLKKTDSDVPVGPIDPTITTKDMSCGVDEVFDVSQMFSSNSEGTITYYIKGANGNEYNLNGKYFSSKVAGTYTIKAYQTAVDGKFNDGEATATLTVLTKYATTFMSNNTLWIKNILLENEGLVFPDAPKIEGYVFMGWTTSSTVDVDGNGIIYAKEGDAINANTSFYAVFAVQKGNGEGETKTLNVVPSYRLDHYSYGDYDINGWAGHYLINNNGSNYYLQLDRTTYSTSMAYNSHLATKESENAIESITIQTNNNTVAGRCFYLCDRNDVGAASEENATFGYGSINEKNGSVTINVVGAPTRVYIYTDGIAYVSSISVKYCDAFFSNYTTTPTFPESVIHISSVGKATAYVGFDATVSGAKAYYISSVGDGIAQLTEVVGTIPAGTGVFLMTEGGEGSAIFIPAALGTGDVALAQDNMLKGTVYPSGELFNEQGHTYYALRNGEHGVCFYWDPDTQDEGASAKCACGKAILDVPSTDSAPSSSIGIRFDGSSLIVNTDLNEEKCYHDFLGHKVEKPSTGLYIVNGKKILVK